MKLAIRKGIRRMTILGDSVIVIRKIFKSKFERVPPNSTIVNKISPQLEKFEEISLFHIFRNLSMEANKLANKGATLRQGILELNQGQKIFSPLT